MKIMAKMVNPNTVTDMALVNARAQMKTQQLLQKVGKGKRKVQVTLSKNVRSYLSTMTKEMKSRWQICFNFLIILKRKQK